MRGMKNCSCCRRSFLESVAGALALAGCRSSGLGRVPRHRSDYRGIEIGVITYSWWHWDYDRKGPVFAGADKVIAEARTAGLGTVELMGEDAEVSLGVANSRPKTPAEHEASLRERLAIRDAKWIALREKFASAGISIHTVKFGWIGDAGGSAAEDDYFCKVAKLLGAKAITREIPIRTSERFRADEGPGAKLDLETARRCAAAADRNGIVIAFHNHMQVNMLTYDSPLLALSPNLMINFDIGHFVAANETDAMDFVRKYRDRIFSIHIKDRTTPAHGSKNLPWGQGDTPLVPLFRHMLDASWFPHCDIEFEYPVPSGSTATREIGVCNRYCRDRI